MVIKEAKPQSEHFIRLWQTVQAIPVGKVASYGQIADLAGLPGRARLVSKALQAVPENGWRNQTVPWFRVINSQGKISLPASSDAFKQQINLLQQEGVVVIAGRVKLSNFQWQPDLAELLFHLDY